MAPEPRDFPNGRYSRALTLIVCWPLPGTFQWRETVPGSFGGQCASALAPLVLSRSLSLSLSPILSFLSACGWFGFGNCDSLASHRLINGQSGSKPAVIDTKLSRTYTQSRRQNTALPFCPGKPLHPSALADQVMSDLTSPS